jgi:zinc transport system substrate-binding protein
MLRRTLALAVSALTAAAALSACGDDGADPAAPAAEKMNVVMAFYPLQFISERIGGDAVSVTNLAKPGAEPHDLELSPQQVAEISEADLVVYLKGFQPQVDEAVEQQAADKAFDVATVEPLHDAAADAHGHEGEEGAAEEEEHEEAEGGKDPHVWLDPTRLARIGDVLATRMGQTAPDATAGFTERAAALHTDLDALDGEYADGLKTCQRREIVTSHTAFGYLAEKYGLEQIGITGLTPEDEPSAQRLADVTEEAREHKATTIFFETLVSPKVAETIAREVGAQTAVLDPIEGLQPGSTGDYLSVMRANLAALRTALGCG